MIVCRNCGTQSPDDSLYCRSCGLRVAPYTEEEAKAYAESLRPAAQVDTKSEKPPKTDALHDRQGLSICTNCLYRGSPVTTKKGSLWMELLMWSFIVPGPFYTVWRLKSRQHVCPQCGRPGMIPVETPVGQRLVKYVAESGSSSD